MHAEVLDPLSDPRWPSFVAQAPEAVVFHHPAWLALLRAEYGYPVAAWTLCDADRAVVGGLPIARVVSRLTGRRLVALPFCDLCGPVLAGGAADEARAELLATIADQRARIGLPLDIHESVEGLGDATASRSFLHHVVELADDPVTVEARFTKSHVKRGARKAERLGLRIERRLDRAGLDEFYRLHVETRRYQGVPVQSKRFIRRFEGLFAEGLGHVALVRDPSGRVLAAAVFLTFNGTLTYKYGASDRAELGKRPNNLLFLDAIRWGCAQGMRRLDLGRTDLDNQGLREFKLSWGAAERRLSYTWVSDRPLRSRGTGVPTALQVAIRRGPPLVGRAIGKALYRHTA